MPEYVLSHTVRLMRLVRFSVSARALQHHQSGGKGTKDVADQHGVRVQPKTMERLSIMTLLKSV